MILILAIVAGLLSSMGLYMILRRSLVKIIIGFIMLSHAANLVIFLSGKFVISGVPLIEGNALQIVEKISDPLPQALILTAIVIGFGMLAFTIVLVHRVFREFKSDDLNILRKTDKF